LADRLIQATGWSVRQAHPGYVKRMKQNPDKTDYSDAHLLAELVRVGFLPTVWLAPPEIRDLRLLVRYRQQLVNEGRNTKLRIRALLRGLGRAAAPSLWTKAGLRWLAELSDLPRYSRWVLDRYLKDLARIQQSLAEAQEQLDEVARQDAVVQQLLQQRGVGTVTACVMRAEIGYFERFRTGKQLARFCGLTPRNASSGARQADAGLVRAGNPLLRATLIEAAHRLKRYDPKWREFQARLLAAGKPGSVIAAAVANRWMRRLFHDVTSPQSRPAA
jgi:transposase